jgi:hypothetical protein
MLQLSSLLFLSEAWGDNPRFTFWIRGSCDETIEGVAGTRLDDGSGGAPDFKNTRPGINFEILLTQANIVEEFWSTPAWQWSLGVEGPLEITDITLRGTVSCHPRDPPPDGGPQCLGGPTGLAGAIAELTGLPYGKGPQTLENHGARSIVVLGLQFASLPGIGDYVVAKVRVSGTFPETEGESVAGRIFFTTRIGSSGAPIVPSVTYNGEGVTETKGAPRLRLLDCPLVLKAVGPIDNFIRCDSTDDGRLDIADPVRILEQLFLGEGAPIRCPAAADCNGDGKRDLSDAIYGLSYLFLGTAPPPAPYPDCARPEGTTAEDCPGGSTRCP